MNTNTFCPVLTNSSTPLLNEPQLEIYMPRYLYLVTRSRVCPEIVNLSPVNLPLGLNTIVFDSSKCIVNFHLEQYSLNLFKLVCNPVLVSENNTKSSVYSRWLTTILPILQGIHVSSNKHLRSSMYKQNKSGLKPSPCLIPTVVLKYFVMPFCSFTLVQVLEYISLIIL